MRKEVMPCHLSTHAKKVRDKVPQSSWHVLVDSKRQGNVVALVIAVQQSIKSNLVFANQYTR
jgi:hypothetical protein